MTYSKELLNIFLNEKVSVAVRTPEEWEKFMQLLEEKTNVKWQAGQNPTEYNNWDVYEGDSAITCGYIQKSRLSLHATDYYKEYGYEIIEFKELIKGEEEMESTGQNYRELFIKTKIGGFFMNKGYFTGFRNYKGYVLSTSSSKQVEYLDFLAEMRDYGIERDEIEQIIIKDYLTEKGSKNE